MQYWTMLKDYSNRGYEIANIVMSDLKNQQAWVFLDHASKCVDLEELEKARGGYPRSD